MDKLKNKNTLNPNVKDDSTVSVNFNMKSEEISVQSNKKTATGDQPLFEWKMNLNGG